VIPIFATVPVLAGAAGFGFVVDRALGGALGGGAVRWPLRCLVVGAIVYLFLIGGWLVLPGVVLAAWLGRRAPAVARDDRGALAAAVAALVVALALGVLRPAYPLYWDAFVWLGKARLAARHFGALRELALTPGSGVIPSGYPLFYPAAAAWLGGMRDDAAAVVAGATAFKLVALWLFATALAAAPRGRAALVLLVLFATPLWLVHLRSTYVDLSIGLFAASLLLLVHDARSLVGIAAVAIVLTGTKDEGFAHVVAVGGVMLVAGGSGRRRAALIAIGAATVAFLLWHGQLALHHVARDHALGPPALAALPALGRALAVALGDFVSWGALWPLVLAALIVLVRRRSTHRDAVLYAEVLAAEAALFALAIACGSERVRAFAVGGTLVNRLLVQLAPTAALLVAAVAAPDDPPR